ncbi:MAG TPA: glycosyltransferase [Thermoanaerobaculia bacterium]|nr:glycosyltransferase [Thermoanaerobaculia bacterium]
MTPVASPSGRPLDILFLTQTYPRFAEDTAGPFIRDLARGLVRLGDRVTVLAPHDAGLGAGWDDGGVEVVTFRYAPEAWEVLGYGRSLEADEGIKLKAGLVAPLYVAAARRALGKLLRERPRDVVQGHWVVPNGLVTTMLPRSTEGPRIAVGLHGSDVFLAERRGFRRLVRRALGRTDVLTGCSPELVDRVCALGFPRQRAHVIPYGVDVETFRPRGEASPGERDAAAAWRRRLGVPEGAPLVLTVGRMATKKGFDVLIAARPELRAAPREAHWVLAGAGDRLEEWRQAAAGLEGGERVHFPGAVLRDVLPDLYRAADLFVLPAVHDARGNVDGLPNVILEAMASGLPVVASGISGIPLAVVDGENGVLVPERDPRALAAALAGLLGAPERRRDLGTAGRRRAVGELTWDAVARRYREAYLAP